jgi:hypothetical protein
VEEEGWRCLLPVLALLLMMRQLSHSLLITASSLLLL